MTISHLLRHDKRQSAIITSTMTEITVDEIIINCVRDNAFLYDKKSPDFKNVQKKKNTWETISNHLNAIYNTEITASDIARRWASLRDQFCRENRKRKLAPSGSGYEPKKEWDLYKTMTFLLPHIAHRRTTTSLNLSNSELDYQTMVQPQRIIIPNEENIELNLEDDLSDKSSCQYDDPLSTVDFFRSSSALSECSSDSQSLLISPPLVKLTSKSKVPSLNIFAKHTNQDKNIHEQLNAIENTEQINDKFHSASVLSCNTSCSKSSSKTITPPLDTFAKRRRANDQLIDKELAAASSAISAAVNSLSNFATNKEKDTENGFTQVIEESLKHVPSQKRTQCYIEILQVIQKYEERS